jgi:hypothetical protein
MPSLGLQIAELPTSLRTLVLGGQTITSACARALPLLTRLRALRAARFENDDDLAVLRLLPELETLSIGGVSSVSGYAAIGDVRSLRRLALWWQADECVPLIEAALANDQLVELDLNPGQFTSHLLPRVAGLANLERLVLRSIALSDDTLELRALAALAHAQLLALPLRSIRNAARRYARTCAVAAHRGVSRHRFQSSAVPSCWRFASDLIATTQRSH